MDHLIADIDGIGKALGVRPAFRALRDKMDPGKSNGGALVSAPALRETVS